MIKNEYFIYEFNKENYPLRIIREPFRDFNNLDRTAYLYDSPKYGQNYVDYVRFRILGQVSEEIKKNKIKGNLAELGVLSGAFAEKINFLFPNKKLFLYDTFEGFDERDVDTEDIKNEEWYTWINNYSKNVDLITLIKNRMPYLDNVVFKKGYFPLTAHDEINEIFCLVSIDVDIYLPTLNGLRFFYERLSEGGYIFVHDSKFEGVQKAICEFNESINCKLKYIPICDMSESIVICK